MSNFITCSNRGDRRVDLAVCLKRCESRSDCSNLKTVPRETLLEAAKKAGIPAKALGELEAVIDVERESEESPVKTELSSTDCGKNFKSSRNDNGNRSECADVSDNLPIKAEVVNPGDGKAKKAMELYERLLILKKDVGTKLVEMGELLNEFYDQKYYIDVGYKDWNQFCEEALDFTARWVLDIRKIAFKKNELNLSDRDVAEVGVKKMAQLVPVMTNRREADRWMNEAKKPGMTTERLVSRVRHARGRITKDEADKVPIMYHLQVYEEDRETVERAFELAAEVTLSDSRGVQFVGICQEFRQTYEHESGDFDRKRIVTGMVKRIEGMFKVKIGEIVDAETGEILER